MSMCQQFVISNLVVVSASDPKGSVAVLDTVTKAVLTWVLDMLDRGQSVAMASVIEATGSVPVQAWSPDGNYIGWRNTEL